MICQEIRKFQPSRTRENRMNTKGRLNYYTSEAENAFLYLEMALKNRKMVGGLPERKLW